jgi:ADP-ribosylglycohydrolase
MSRYGSYSWVHTISNAAIVLLELLCGKSNFERSIGISVMSGLDTDCNGATCGSILGAMLGVNSLPPKWVSPFDDRLKTAVFGFYECHISELAKRTILVGKTLMSQK